MDKIEIRDLEIFANHGVFPEETALGQKFVVSAVMYTETRPAGLTDDLFCFHQLWRSQSYDHRFSSEKYL